MFIFIHILGLIDDVEENIDELNLEEKPMVFIWKKTS